MNLVSRAGRALPDEAFRRLKYRQQHGVWPDLRDPKRFTEKMNWRILHDRRPCLAWTCDKVAMKEHASELRPDLRIPPTLWMGTDLDELRGIDLPDRWMLKPNSSSGRFHRGSGRVDRADVEKLRAVTEGWLDRREHLRLREWAYGLARPVFVVEGFIGPHAVPPPDYKIFCFEGVPRIFQVVSDRFVERRKTFFTPEWEHIEVTSMQPSAPDFERPPTLDRVLQAAADLSAGYDHIRIDLYDDDGDLWFGEFTPYSWSGLERIDPVEIDFRWGAYWNLPTLSENGTEAIDTTLE